MAFFAFHRSSFTTCTCLLLVSGAFAQVRPGGAMMEHEDKQHNAIALDLALPVDATKDYFEDYMKEQYDARVKGMGFLRNKTVLSVERAELPALHANAMDLFIRFEEVKEDATLVLLIGRDGYDLYFGSGHEPATHERLVAMMRNFKTYALEEHYKTLLAEQQDDLEKLVRAQEKMTRTVSRNKDEQTDNRKRNRELDEDIKDLEKKKADAAKAMDQLREDILRSKAELPADN